jgi:hypothetical protein
LRSCKRVDRMGIFGMWRWCWKCVWNFGIKIDRFDDKSSASLCRKHNSDTASVFEKILSHRPVHRGCHSWASEERLTMFTFGEQGLLFCYFW